MNFVQTLLAAAKTVKTSGAILVAICSLESGLTNLKSPQDHGSPSYGVCQVKYDTAVMLGYEGEPEGLMDPKTNAKYAATYLKYQFDRYGNWCHAIAAYNAGRYNPSKKEPGHPRNIKYVIKVGQKLNKRFRETVSCDRVNYVAENNGARRRIQPAQP